MIDKHGEEEMDEDGLSIFDVENAVLTGTIIERQRDNEKVEWKYNSARPNNGLFTNCGRGQV